MTLLRKCYKRGSWLGSANDKIHIKCAVKRIQICEKHDKLGLLPFSFNGEQMLQKCYMRRLWRFFCLFSFPGAADPPGVSRCLPASPGASRRLPVLQILPASPGASRRLPVLQILPASPGVSRCCRSSRRLFCF